jgi:hypothetical protein
VHSSRDDDPPLLLRQRDGHERAFRQGCGAVVHRGIGDIHARQRGHEALELVNDLQRTLCHFWLIGGVRGVELSAREDLPNSGWHKMAVAAGT